MALAFLTGCGEYEPAKPNRPAAAKEEGAKEKEEGSKEKGEGGREKGEAGKEKVVAPPTREKAQVGVGEKGRGYGAGPVATPVAALFASKERIIFEMRIPEAMKIYKALNGRAPKSHEEFMKGIIEADRIKLPELPPDIATYTIPNKNN